MGSNPTRSLYNQIAIVESPHCRAVRAIERFPIVTAGTVRPGRIDMWCVSLLITVTPCQQDVDPAKGLTVLTQMDIVSAQKRIIGRVRVCIFGSVAQLVEHLIEAQGVGGSNPSRTIG